jgi:hypothetical protein
MLQMQVTVLAFSQKMSDHLPETVFQHLFKVNFVAKEIVLSFITEFSQST